MLVIHHLLVSCQIVAALERFDKKFSDVDYRAVKRHAERLLEGFKKLRGTLNKTGTSYPANPHHDHLEQLLAVVDVYL